MAAISIMINLPAWAGRSVVLTQTLDDALSRGLSPWPLGRLVHAAMPEAVPCFGLAFDWFIQIKIGVAM